MSKAKSPATFFNRGAALWVTLLFIVLLVASNIFVRMTCINIWEADCPLGWPLSLFTPRIPEIWQLLLAFALALSFIPIVRWIGQRGYRLRDIWAFGLLLLLATNALLGWYFGFEHPMTHGEKRYYHEALNVDNPVQFVRDFTAMQPNLLEHSQTHPPGAVLTVGIFTWTLGNAGFVSIAVGLLTMALTVPLVHAFFQEHIQDESLVGYGTLLFVILPSVQIYFLASLEAFIMLTTFGTIYFFSRKSQNYWSFGLATLCLFFTSFITFGFLFLLPLLLAYELIQHRSVWRFALMVTIIAVIHTLIALFLDFNYLESFRIASQIENPDGFRLVAMPVDYTFSRAEGIAEVFVFFGPFLTVLMLRGWRRLRHEIPEYGWLLVLSWASFLAMLATGAFRTGETARLMMFLYPLMLTPVLMVARNVEEQARTSLLVMVFTQTLFMQLLAHFIY